MEKFSHHVKFTYLPQTVEAAYGLSDDIKILFIDKDNFHNTINKRVSGNIKVFELEAIYSEHADLVQDLILKAIGTNWQYLNILKNSFVWEISEEELHRIAFGVFPNEEDYHKRPFSQMTNDIAKELGLII
jgi:hypothetical protein